jgi:hypothetical protein
MRRGVMSGGSPMVLRRCGQTGVRAAAAKTGSRVGATAWIVGGTRVLWWLFASRSITQKDVALAGQVWATGWFDGGSIE